MEARHDDDEALEPHADVDDHGHREERRDAVAHLLDPQHLRHEAVAEDERPVDRRVRTLHAVQDHVALELVRAVPAEEHLHRVAVEHDEARHQHHLRHVVEVLQGDEVLQAVHRAQGNGERQDHREAGVDRARDEVGREDRGVPARDDADREVETDDRVHRHHERRRQPREQEVRRLVAVPVLRRAAPAERRDPVDLLEHRVLRLVAQRRKVGDETHEPEEQRDGRVGRDREHVPHERTPELRPETHRVRIRQQPVGRDPRPPGVHEREDGRARHREERHRLGEAIDRRSPLLVEQEQDRRDERAGVTDPDPPDQVDDREAPAHGVVDAPDTRPFHEQVSQRVEEHHRQQETDEGGDVPRNRRCLREDDRRDLVGDRPERVTGPDDLARFGGGRAVVHVSFQLSAVGRS